MIALLLCYAFSLMGSLAFLIYHINIWRYPIYYSAPLILAVYLPVSVTILLPLDYVSHTLGTIGGFQLSDDIILMLWKGTYWSTFMLTWIILPILKEYYRAGNYLKLEKLKSSLKRNAKFQAISLLCLIACAVYLVLEIGLTFKNLKSMIIALSHIYALVLALWLMAHGMITIPRNWWVKGNLVQSLNHEYMRVPKLVDTLEDTKSDFKEDILQVMILKENFTDATTFGDFAYRDWILDLEARIPGDLKDAVKRQYVYEPDRTISRDQVTHSFMSNLTFKFQTHLFKLLAHSSEYDLILQRIVNLQALIDAKCYQSWNDRLQVLECNRSHFFPKLNFYFRCFMVPVLSRVQSVLIYSLSFTILESELFHSTDLSLINMVTFKAGIFRHNFTQAIFLLFIFMYMLFCAVNSLAALKVFNMYHLVPRHSDPVSACFYGSYIARMTIPLSYNFIALFTSRKSIFEEWYGQSIHLAGLFNLMNSWIPRLLLIPVVLTTFNLYDKVKSKIGIKTDINGWVDFEDEQFDGSSPDHEQLLVNSRELTIVEAKRLVQMELKRRDNRVLEAKKLFHTRTGIASQRDVNAENSTDTSSRDFSQSGGNLSAPDLWARFGDTFYGLKRAVEQKFDRTQSQGDMSLQYHDYDNDSDEHLIV